VSSDSSPADLAAALRSHLANPSAAPSVELIQALARAAQLPDTTASSAAFPALPQQAASQPSSSMAACVGPTAPGADNSQNGSVGAASMSAVEGKSDTLIAAVPQAKPSEEIHSSSTAPTTATSTGAQGKTGTSGEQQAANDKDVLTAPPYAVTVDPYGGGSSADAASGSTVNDVSAKSAPVAPAAQLPPWSRNRRISASVTASLAASADDRGRLACKEKTGSVEGSGGLAGAASTIAPQPQMDHSSGSTATSLNGDSGSLQAHKAETPAPAPAAPEVAPPKPSAEAPALLSTEGLASVAAQSGPNELGMISIPLPQSARAAAGPVQCTYRYEIRPGEDAELCFRNIRRRIEVELGDGCTVQMSLHLVK